MCFRTNSVHCIVPPHMLQKISENGTPLQQERARHNLVSSKQIRAARAVTSGEPGFIEAPSEFTTVKERLVYDAEQGSVLPGILVRGEGDPSSSDAAINEAYDGAGATYDLFKEIYGRNSIDNRGMTIESSIHYRVGYDNAFWDGQQMVYGDGDENLPEDERLFNRFTIAMDVIAHELTHGITQFEAGLLYRGQSGALNESISDVFGALVNQYSLGELAKAADWMIGKGLFTANVNARGIRSLKEPGTAYDDPVIGKDLQPAHMDAYVHTVEDSGGVHINSGIPNHAFYVTSVELGGYAWEKAGRIWYVTLTDKISGDSDFQEFSDLTFAAAGELYGAGSLEQQAVRRGWAAVGIKISESDGSGSDGPGSGSGGGQSGCLQSLLSLSAVRWFRNQI
jgi:Zn-dependent metalloprotease